MSILPLVLPACTMGANAGSSWSLIAKYSVMGVVPMPVNLMVATVPVSASMGYKMLLFAA